MSVKPVQRSQGHSATAASAYRSGEKVVDEQTGEIHDYTKRSGVESTNIITPKNVPQWANNREQLWNKAEEAETRKNSIVAREFEVAIPHELNKEQRKELIKDYSQKIVDRHKVVVDYAIHEPHKKGDDRNYHAHILATTRRINEQGLTEKTRELDLKYSGEIKHWREQWAITANEHLAQAGHDKKIDHRSFKDQGIDKIPTIHIGKTGTALDRNGEYSERIEINKRIKEKNREIEKTTLKIKEIEQEIKLIQSELEISKITKDIEPSNDKSIQKIEKLTPFEEAKKRLNDFKKTKPIKEKFETQKSFSKRLKPYKQEEQDLYEKYRDLEEIKGGREKEKRAIGKEKNKTQLIQDSIDILEKDSVLINLEIKNLENKAEEIKANEPRFFKKKHFESFELAKEELRLKYFEKRNQKWKLDNEKSNLKIVELDTIKEKLKDKRQEENKQDLLELKERNQQRQEEIKDLEKASNVSYDKKEREKYESQISKLKYLRASLDLYQEKEKKALDKYENGILHEIKYGKKEKEKKGKKEPKKNKKINLNQNFEQETLAALEIEMKKSNFSEDQKEKIRKEMLKELKERSVENSEVGKVGTRERTERTQDQKDDEQDLGR